MSEWELSVSVKCNCVQNSISHGKSVTVIPASLSVMHGQAVVLSF
jgi:hypothetical protein